MIFWNVAELKNKDAGFWKRLGEWDVITLMETWLDKKKWIEIKGKLPKGFRWGKQYAVKKNKKRRAMGGMIMGIRRDLAEEKGGLEAVEEGVMTGRVRIGEEKWRILGVYVREDIEKKLEGLKKWMEGNGEKETRIIIGGTLMREQGNILGRRIVIDKEENNQKSRNSKDKKVNREGRRLIEALEESGWSILNGSMRGDEEGEYTYTGSRGNTVIDYVIGNEEVREKVVRVEVREEVDADHQPVICWIKGEGVEKRGKTGQRVRRGLWDEERCERFRKKIGRIEMRKHEEVRIEIERMNGRIKQAMEESEKGEKEVGKRYRGWWDKECIEKKKEVRRELEEGKENRRKIQENKNRV